MMRINRDLEGDLNPPPEENLSDDDNAAPDMQSEADDGIEKEDPLLLAIDDLEGRVVQTLDDVKLHLGVRSLSAPGSPSVHEELATLLQPVVEVAAHTAPSVARTYYHGIGSDGVEASCEDVYQRVVSDLVLPVMLEMAQSDTIAAKRGASLEFFRNLWKEMHQAGSWLDSTTTGPQQGPYGSGSTSHHHNVPPNMANPAVRAQQKRRFQKRLAREGEILRYWIQASIACTVEGVFTSEAAEIAVASRGIIAASASLRPSLKHIAQRIKDADDRGASRLFGPIMKMVEGVLKKLFLSTNEESGGSGDAIRSSCVKFLEIVILCCSRKPKDAAHKRKSHGASSDFGLEDLPAGHPVITREALESIAEYSFATLRGLTMMGGQVRIDPNLLSDMLLTGGGDGSPAAQVVSILKPAALAYLEIESTLQGNEDDEQSLEFTLDRSSLEFDFQLSQKPYSLTLNAMSALAMNRPVFFKEVAVCLARRAVKPPIFAEDGPLTKSGVIAITAHLKAACLTLLRNALSVTANASGILHAALKTNDMEIQADKALSMAKQANALKTAGRAARNRANMFYEWEAAQDTDKRSKKRETDDALAKMRAAKKARGLGHGIQLPTNMSDAVELVIANLFNLPSKKPAAAASAKARKVPMTLDFIVDAIMTNGASLTQEEGRWYDRDGGNAWTVDLESQEKYLLSSKFFDNVVTATSPAKKKKGEKAAKDPKVLFHEQAQVAASDALGRLVMQSANSRSKFHADFGHSIASRLAWTLGKVQPAGNLKPAFEIASESASSAKRKLEDPEKGSSLENFVQSYPLVSACLALDATAKPESSVTQKPTNVAEAQTTLGKHILFEAFAQSQSSIDDSLLANAPEKYGASLEMFVASVVHAGERSSDKPSDVEWKKVAAQSAVSLQHDFSILPSLPASSLSLLCAMCDVDDITKKAKEAERKTSQQTIAASAAIHAAKVAAEKRATMALLILRDVAFQRSNVESRRGAVDCAVRIASGRLPASAAIEDKALKLVMNVLFPKSDALARFVIEAATSELEKAAALTAEKHDEISEANKKEASNKADHHHAQTGNNNLAPASDVEKQVMEQVKKPAVLYMALCVRKPEIIQYLFEISCRSGADALAKAVRVNMSKLARAASAKHGADKIAMKVANMVGPQETPLLLSFLENLVPEKGAIEQTITIIDACHEIQASKAGEDGKKDTRYLIPVVSAMKRTELAEKLGEFVSADDKIFLAALERMGDRVARQALLYRDEPDEEVPSLRGMTLCEQLVFLHNLDFAAIGLQQKRYLDVIRLCLDNDEIFNDRVVQSALDHMSGIFLTGEQGLPLAYMRTIILVCSKHESLHSWICHILLPRLVEGKIYTDRRQWEGWMRCAKMLENTGEGVSSIEAIRKLPEEQFELYRTRYGEPGQS